MESIRNVDRYLSPAQFFKCFCIQHQKEGALVLEGQLLISLAIYLPNFWKATKQYLKPLRNMSFYTWFGVMTTDRMTPSSSSTAPGDETKIGSEGYMPACFHTCHKLKYQFNWLNIKFTNTNSTCINLILLTNPYLFALKVHFNEGVSNQVSEATCVEVTVGTGIAHWIVDVWEFQTSIFMEIITMEIFMCAKHLYKYTIYNICYSKNIFWNCRCSHVDKLDKKLSTQTNLILVRLDGCGSAVQARVEILPTGCMTVHVQWQDKAAGEHSAHCVVYLAKTH